MRFFILPIILLIVPTIVAAQEPAPPSLTLSGQLRLRSEIDDLGMTATETTVAHLLRTRLRVTARPAPQWMVVAEVQDSRFMGSGNPTLGRGTFDASADGLDMRQAYAQVARPFDLPLTLRLGRQEFSFSNERLIGAVAWSNTGRSFDGGRGTVNIGDEVALDLFASRLSAPLPGPTSSQNLYGIWGAWKGGSGGVDLYALRDDNTRPIVAGSDSGKSILIRNTIGATIQAIAGPIHGLFELIGQKGDGSSSDSTARKEIKAFLLSGTITITADAQRSTKITVLATLLSGDGSSGDGVNESFNTLFATNHKFYGTMDYFPTLSDVMGLVDLGGGVSTMLVENMAASLEGHMFGPQRGSSDPYGTEMDLAVTWKGKGGMELSGGMSLFMPGDLLESRLGNSTRFWGYLSGQWTF